MNRTVMERMLTTKDNPFDPFEEVDDWRAFDTQKGYNTEALIARICRVSDEEGDESQKEAWNNALDDIMKYVDYGIYEIVER